MLAYAREDASPFIHKGAIYNIDKAAQALTSIINKLEGQLKDEAVYPWYIRVSGVSAALLPNVAGAGHTVFEADGQAAYLIDAATAAQIEEISKKIEVLGGKVELAMKKLAE